MDRNVAFLLFIVGMGIAIGGLVRLFLQDGFLLPAFLMGAGLFLAYQTWSFVKDRFDFWS